MKKIDDIINELNESANSLRIVNKELTERLERAETAWKNWNSEYRKEAAKNVLLKEDNSKMKKVVDALNNCEGVKHCIKRGCESCIHYGHDCNSHEVVKVLLEYMGEDK